MPTTSGDYQKKGLHRKMANLENFGIVSLTIEVHHRHMLHEILSKVTFK